MRRPASLLTRFDHAVSELRKIMVEAASTQDRLSRFETTLREMVQAAAPAPKASPPGRRPRSRPAQVRTTTGPRLQAQLVDELTAAKDGLTLTALAQQTSTAKAAVRLALKGLRDAGKVRVQGNARRARWHLVRPKKTPPERVTKTTRRRSAPSTAASLAKSARRPAARPVGSIGLPAASTPPPSTQAAPEKELAMPPTSSAASGENTSPEPLELGSAEELITVLGESAPHICDWLRGAYTALGAPLMQATLDATRQIEANGGLYVKDKSRRKTIGGVFFHALGPRIPAELRSAWPLPKPQPPSTPKRAPAAPPPPTPVRATSIEMTSGARSKTVVVEHVRRRG